MRMEAILVRDGFWDLVTGDETLPDSETDVKKKKAHVKRQAQCKAAIVLRVDDSQLSHMSNSDPKAIWDALKKVHRARGFGSRLQLRRNFITANMKDSQTMESWIGDVRSLANRLTAIEVGVSDEDIIVVLTAGLPPSYIPVVISFDAVDIDKLTLDFVITRLLNEEGRQQNSQPAAEVKTEDQDVAMRAEKGARPDVICYYCLESGHFASICPQKTRDIKRREEEGHDRISKGLRPGTAASADLEGNVAEEENYAF